jgi:hypothetical protein
MTDWAALQQLGREACTALAAAIHAGTAAPPPPRPQSRHDARDWAITLGRWRDGRTYRSLGADHGGLSVKRVRQIVGKTARRWACVHVAGWEARRLAWFEAYYGRRIPAGMYVTEEE